MTLPTERYVEQVARWPTDGQYIVAHFDAESIVVYQAYRPAIARFAVEHRRFGDGFSYARMSWIKPNFLWMMYRSGWGTKPDQEATLALRLRRTFFDELLATAVRSSFDPAADAARDAWQASVAASDVRLQWDPDHHPNGTKQTRRAIQLGLRGRTLERFGTRELLDVVDLSEFVATQRPLVVSDLPRLEMPVERSYLPTGEEVARRVGLGVALS